MEPAISTRATDAPARSEPFLVGFDPLAPLSATERKQRLDAYLDFLRNRDGEPNVDRRTLSRREAWLHELEQKPVRYKGKLDRSAFYANLTKRPGPDVDPKILWLLATAKANRAEHYGVTLDLELHGDVANRYGGHMKFIDLEEFYHTRILRECVKTFDLDFDLEPPKTFTRFFTTLVVRSPQWPRLVTALCGELFGSVAFQLLWEKIELFDDDPATAARLRLLVREILIDEMGHAAYGHAKLGAAGLSVVRGILPYVSSYFMQDLPEFAYLGGGRGALLKRIAEFDLGSNQELWGKS
jgi:hypothetical protein